MRMNSDQDMQTTGHESGPGSLLMRHPLRRTSEIFVVLASVLVAVVTRDWV